MRHRAWDLKPAQTHRVHERFLYLGWDLRGKRGKHVTLYYSDGFEGALWISNSAMYTSNLVTSHTFY